MVGLPLCPACFLCCPNARKSSSRNPGFCPNRNRSFRVGRLLPSFPGPSLALCATAIRPRAAADTFRFWGRAPVKLPFQPPKMPRASSRWSISACARSRSFLNCWTTRVSFIAPLVRRIVAKQCFTRAIPASIKGRICAFTHSVPATSRPFLRRPIDG